MSETLNIEVFGRSLTPYALFVIAGALSGLGVFLWKARKRKPAAVILTAVLAVPLCLLGARAFYVAARWSMFSDVGLGHFFRTDDEWNMIWGTINGGALWGAVGGGALAALLGGKIAGEKVSSLLDAMAPGAALAIAFSRFGEFSIGEGVGPDVENPGLCFAPVAVVNEWDEWKFAVYLAEALVALIIFVVLMKDEKKWTGGNLARLFLILYSSCQIILEALRRDNFLRWLFVRVSQLTAALVLAGLIVAAVIRWARARKQAPRPGQTKIIVCCAVFLACIGLAIGMEFAVDKSASMSVELCYLIEALCAAGIGVTAYQVVLKRE